MKRHLFCIGKYLLLYLAGALIYYVFEAFTFHILYPVLNNYLPEIFVTYNPVLEKTEYLAWQSTVRCASGVMTVISVNAIDVIYDNSRLELLVSRTDGFYRLADGFKIYIKSFLSVDIISSLISPAVFIPLTLISLPERFVRIEELIHAPLVMTEMISIRLGHVVAYFVIALSSLVTRACAVWLGLKRWRGLWLSDIGNEVR